MPMKLTRVNAGERTKAIEIARANRAFETQRSRFESAGQAGKVGVVHGSPVKATLPQHEHAIVGPRVSPNRAIGQAAPERAAVRPDEARHEVLKPVVPNKSEAREVRPNEPPLTAPQPSLRRDEEIRNREAPKADRPNTERPRTERPEVQRPRAESEPHPTARHPQAPNLEPAHSEPHPAPAPVRRPEPQKK